MRGAAHSLAANLSPADEIAVVAFSSEAHLLLPFSTDRALLDRAIQSKNLAGVENSSESNIYESYFSLRAKCFAAAPQKGDRPADRWQDSGLGLTWDASSAQPREGAASSRLAFDDVARSSAGRNRALHGFGETAEEAISVRAWFARHIIKASRDEAAPSRGCALDASQVRPRPLSCPSVSRTIAFLPVRPRNISRA